MKKSDVYEIAIKILGFYLVVICIEQLRGYRYDRSIVPQNNFFALVGQQKNI